MRELPGGAAYAGSTPPTEQELFEFAQRWSLDAECWQALVAQTPEVQRASIAEFSPKSMTRDPKRLFLGFMRSLATSAVSGVAAYTPGSLGPELDDFAIAMHTESLMQGWGLSTEEEPLLGSSAMVEALHGGSLANPSLHELRSPRPVAIARRPPVSNEPVSELDLTQFAQKWALDGDCVAALAEQSPAIQHKALESFSPKPGTRDITKLFLSFIKSLSTGTTQGRGGNGGRKGANDDGSFVSWSDDPFWGGGAGADAQSGGDRYGAKRGYPGGSAEPVVPPSEQELVNFLVTWALDEEASAALFAQEPDVQVHLMAAFKPREGTRDVKSLFFGFLKSLVMGPNQRGKRARVE